MLPDEALREVMNIYGIEQKDIVKASGLNRSLVSRFVKGDTDINSKNLQKIVSSLPSQPKAHYYMLFSDAENSNHSVKITGKTNIYNL